MLSKARIRFIRDYEVQDLAKTFYAAGTELVCSLAAARHFCDRKAAEIVESPAVEIIEPSPAELDEVGRPVVTDPEVDLEVEEQQLKPVEPVEQLKPVEPVEPVENKSPKKPDLFKELKDKKDKKA